MGATAAVHPTDPMLQAYGLGKLDDLSSDSVSKHLESCDPCQRRVAELSSDDFLGRLRDAQVKSVKAPSGWSPSAPSSTDGVSGSNVPPPPAETLPPELVDHPDWEIIRELGRGGMGVVYLARNKLMGRQEVLKVVGRHLIERPGVLDRFLREIQSAARLQHVNIVTAYSAIRVGPSLVLTMEYVKGFDLAKIVKARGPLPVAHACHFVHQAALGLQHAHERGMVHRDIKPANLMVGEGKKAVVKVLDFGLAKVTSEGESDSNLTREGQTVGTPDFIAPEQIRDARSADIRADIYSLGCTLYYLLSGGPPFQGEHIWDIYQAHFSMDAGPVNLVRPEVPVELAAVVAKMMAKEPGRRFQTPGDVARALTPFFKAASAQPGRLRIEGTSDRSGVDANRTSQTGKAPRHPVAADTVPSRIENRVSKSGTDVGWDSLIDVKPAGPLVVPERSKRGITVLPVANGSVEERSRMPLPAALAACALSFIALGVIVITIKTPSGQIKVTVDDQVPLKVKSHELTVEHKPTRDIVLRGTTSSDHEAVSRKEPTAPPGRKTELGQNGGGNSPARTPTTEGRATPKSVDLIKLFDPASGVLGGNWTKEKGKITCEDRWGCKAIEFPRVPFKEYDFQVKFVANGGYDALQQVCYANNRRFLWTLSGRLNCVSGFGDINGVAYESTATRVESKEWIVGGNRYSSVVKVRSDGVEAYLDGRLVAQWKTDYNDMSLPGYVQPTQPATLGLVFWGTSLTVEAAEVTEFVR